MLLIMSLILMWSYSLRMYNQTQSELELGPPVQALLPPRLTRAVFGRVVRRVGRQHLVLHRGVALVEGALGRALGAVARLGPHLDGARGDVEPVDGAVENLERGQR